MNSVTQLGEAIKSVLQDYANQAGVSTGFIQRVREFTGATFAQTVVLGHRPRRRDSHERLINVCQECWSECKHSGN